MEKFNSFYLGIVVQNNDPEYRGRVKVWVPHVNASVYNKWNALKEDRKFKFPGSNIDSDLSLIIDELKDDLPWAEFASAVVGETTTGKYNARFDTLVFLMHLLLQAYQEVIIQTVLMQRIILIPSKWEKNQERCMRSIN